MDESLKAIILQDSQLLQISDENQQYFADKISRYLNNRPRFQNEDIGDLLGLSCLSRNLLAVNPKSLEDQLEILFNLASQGSTKARRMRHAAYPKEQSLSLEEHLVIILRYLDYTEEELLRIEADFKEHMAEYAAMLYAKSKDIRWVEHWHYSAYDVANLFCDCNRKDSAEASAIAGDAAFLLSNKRKEENDAFWLGKAVACYTAYLQYYGSHKGADEQTYNEIQENVRILNRKINEKLNRTRPAKKSKYLIIVKN